MRSLRSAKRVENSEICTFAFCTCGCPKGQKNTIPPPQKPSATICKIAQNFVFPPPLLFVDIIMNDPSKMVKHCYMCIDFKHCSSVFFIYFAQANVSWEWTHSFKKQPINRSRKSHKPIKS